MYGLIYWLLQPLDKHGWSTLYRRDNLYPQGLESDTQNTRLAKQTTAKIAKLWGKINKTANNFTSIPNTWVERNVLHIVENL